MLMEMAHKLHDEPVLDHEPSSQPSVLVTPEQCPHIEQHIFSASSVATSLPIFAITQDWYDLVTKHIQSITILGRLLSQCLVILPTSNKFGS